MSNRYTIHLTRSDILKLFSFCILCKDQSRALSHLSEVGYLQSTFLYYPYCVSVCSVPYFGQSSKKDFPRQKSMLRCFTHKAGPWSEKYQNGSDFASLCAVTWENGWTVGTQSWGFCLQIKKTPPCRLLKVDSHCSGVFFQWSRQCSWTWETPVGKAAFPVQMIVKWNLKRAHWKIPQWRT